MTAPRTGIAVGVLVATLVSGPSARANSAPSHFARAARSVGILRAPKVATLRVLTVDLDLDFRFGPVGESRAAYVIENTDDAPWAGEIAYVAAASHVDVRVDGRPVEEANASVEHDVYFPGSTDEADRYSGMDGPSRAAPLKEVPRFTVFHFPLEVPARGRARFDVTFGAEPGYSVDREDDGDGFYRIPSGSPEIVRDSFVYPLWPTLGFGGGTGTMTVRVHTDRDSRPKDGRRVTFAESSRTDQDVLWTATVPDAKSYEDLGLANVVVERTKKPFPLGAQVFAAGKFPFDREFVAPSLRAAVDVHGRWGGIAAGAETDFQRTVTGVVEYQRGTASAYGSAYYGVGALLNVLPSVTPGVELAGGLRLYVVPVDLALQVFAPTSKKDVATVRLLVGVKVGFGS
ncbi:MAG: hypothetical protein U0169_17020 [Polyangiaceae bacterium]